MDAAEPLNLPWIQHLRRALRDYVVLDLETTELDPQHDRIIQIVALRFRNGQAVATLERYVNPAPREIPHTIRLKLGLENRPDLLAVIESASALAEAADELRVFLGDDPIVAHNGRFDLSFLRAGLGELKNPTIDTMELALLLCPELRRHTLESLRDALGVTQRDIASVWESAGGATTIDAEFLHNASTDVALLAVIYLRLLERWGGFVPTGTCHHSRATS